MSNIPQGQHVYEYDTNPEEAGGSGGCVICGKEPQHPVHITSKKHCGGPKCEHTDVELQIDHSYNGCILCAFERVRAALQGFMDFQISDYYRQSEAAKRYCELRKLGRQAIGNNPTHHETESPQAPIAKLTVWENLNGTQVRAELYSPGLPPGEHDVYCEATNRVRPLETSALPESLRDPVAVMERGRKLLEKHEAVTRSAMLDFLSWLSADVPELQALDVRRLADSWDRYRAKIDEMPS